MPPNAGKAVDAYWEYNKIVGSDDGGHLFTPDEYDQYKKEVLPMRMKNRLYVSWVNTTGMDCVMIGPETKCFCQHRYKEHQTDYKDLPNARPIPTPCKQAGCPCSSFTYVPRNGSQSIRCGCKHTTEEHKPGKPFNCIKAGCKCAGFKSSYTCNCGEPTHAHYTLVETKDERIARGHPVGQDVPYQAMGGLTGFSSLADGYMRLDPSGRGRPDDDFFNAPASNPFEKQFDASSQRKPGESELDFYERRYQERMKAEKTSKPKPIQSSPYDANAKLQTGNRTVARK